MNYISIALEKSGLIDHYYCLNKFLADKIPTFPSFIYLSIHLSNRHILKIY